MPCGDTRVPGYQGSSSTRGTWVPLLDVLEKDRLVGAHSGVAPRPSPTNMLPNSQKPSPSKDQQTLPQHKDTRSSLKSLSIDELRGHRQQGLWCTADSDGDFLLTVKNKAGKQIEVRCSFVAAEHIDYMVSYRWKHFCTVPENGTEIAVNFLNVTERRGRCWVDSLNHLNDDDLKRQVVEGMGELYRTHKVVAEYFLYPAPKSVKEVFRMLMEATRGWMWQEVAVGVGVEEFGSNTGRLCLEMLRLGKDWYDTAKRKGDQWIYAMTQALENCASAGATWAVALEEEDEKWWASMHGGCYKCLLKVPDASVAAVTEMLQARDALERLVMSAAGNLSNTNIGPTHTWVKPDIVAASLAVISTLPKFAGRTHEERVDAVLSEIRRSLLQSVASADPCNGIDFSPAACGEWKVTDMFGLGIQAVRFVGELEEGLDSGRFSSEGRGWVELKHRNRDSFDPLRYSVEIDEAAAMWTGAQPAVGDERDVVTCWVHVQSRSVASGQPASGEADVDICVQYLITACGLRLKFDFEGFEDGPAPARRIVVERGEGREVREVPLRWDAAASRGVGVRRKGKWVVDDSKR
eukprot:638193-Rhodomonas_salina.9